MCSGCIGSIPTKFPPSGLLIVQYSMSRVARLPVVSNQNVFLKQYRTNSPNLSTKLAWYSMGCLNVFLAGTGFAMCSTKESHDSDADLDVDGDDTLEYGKAQYTEADIIPCSGEDQGETKEREALRGAVLK